MFISFIIILYKFHLISWVDPVNLHWTCPCIRADQCSSPEVRGFSGFFSAWLSFCHSWSPQSPHKTHEPDRHLHRNTRNCNHKEYHKNTSESHFTRKKKIYILFSLHKNTSKSHFSHTHKIVSFVLVFFAQNVKY